MITCFVLVKCAPGTYSASGVEPCQPCEKGFYQPDEGKLSCFPCKGKTSTYGPGDKSESYCLGKSPYKSVHDFVISGARSSTFRFR